MKLRRETEKCELCDFYLPTEAEEAIQCVGWEVHHWTYKNIPKEKRTDLSVVCPECHKDAHRIMRGERPNCRRTVWVAVYDENETGPATDRHRNNKLMNIVINEIKFISTVKNKLLIADIADHTAAAIKAMAEN